MYINLGQSLMPVKSNLDHPDSFLRALISAKPLLRPLFLAFSFPRDRNSHWNARIQSGQIYRIGTGTININATHPAAWWRHPRSRVPRFRLAKPWCCRNSSYSSRRTAAKALKSVVWIAFFLIDYLIDFTSRNDQKLFTKYVNIYNIYNASVYIHVKL